MNKYSLILCLTYILCGCSNTPPEGINEYLDSLSLHKGDVVFREGIGFTSKIIKMMDPDGTYTHIGIVTDSAGHLMVIHSVPGEPDYKGDPDRVKMEPLKEFYSFGKAKSGAVMRHHDESKALMAADNAYRLYRKGILFDHSYDDMDTTRMYCSEFVRYVFSISGDSLIDTGNIRNRKRKYIFPSDIYRSKSLFKITDF